MSRCTSVLIIVDGDCMLKSFYTFKISLRPRIHFTVVNAIFLLILSSQNLLTRKNVDMAEPSAEGLVAHSPVIGLIKQ